jgi:hemolysin activation/secretion protein
MFRDQKSRFSLASGLTRKEGNNFLAGQFLGVSSRTLSIFDLDTSYTTIVADGVLSLDLGYSKGTKMLGALKDPAFLPANSPKAQFGKLRYVAGERMSFNTQLTGQQAKDTLYGSEQILIGGLYTVRGFVGTTLSGDSGNYVRNDLSWLTSVSTGQKKIPLRLYTGLDFGSVRNRVPGIPQGRLVGMALGASMNFGMATLDLSATRPISAPAASIKEPTQYWLTLRFNF